MLDMHLPRAAVEQKMRAEGIDPSLLDGPMPSDTSQSAATEPQDVDLDHGHDDTGDDTSTYVTQNEDEIDSVDQATYDPGPRNDR